MKKPLLFLLAVLLLPLAACGKAAPLPRDFYSMQTEPPKTDLGTMWLGMTQDEQQQATGYIRSDEEVRVRFRDGVLKSMTSVVTYIHPPGVTFDMTPDGLKAYFAAMPDVTVTESPNLITAARTIDGTLYYMRAVYYNDGTMKELNVTVDPTIDPLVFPRSN